MSASLYAAYVAACIVIIVVPGPSVTLIVSNSLRFGRRAGLLNVAGTQIGVAIILLLVGIGLTSLIAALGHWFDWVRLAGAAYLIWLGWKLLRSPGLGADAATVAPPRFGFLVQGLLVALSNPKTLVFFGAFLPQFLDPSGNHALQIAVMGATAIIFASISDSAYALLASRAGAMLSTRRSRLIARISGCFLIGGGTWLAFSRAR